MDVSAEAADLVVKEGLEVTESAAKLLGSGAKNIAALLLAIAKQDYKVSGETNAKRLARDPTPAVVLPLKREDMAEFRKKAKEYGILYFIAEKRDSGGSLVSVVSNQSYAAQLNAVMESMHYPIPPRSTAGREFKEERPRPLHEPSLAAQRTGSIPSQKKEAIKPSVKARLEGLKQATQIPKKRMPKTR